MCFVQLGKCFRKYESLADIRQLNSFNKNSGFQFPLKSQKLGIPPWPPRAGGQSWLPPFSWDMCSLLPTVVWFSLSLPNIEAVINHCSCFYDILWVLSGTLSVQPLWAFGCGTPDLRILGKPPGVSCSGSRLWSQCMKLDVSFTSLLAV